MGANGYIGSNLTRYLCDNKEYFVVASSRNNCNIDKRAEFLEYDLENKLDSPNEFIEIFGIVDICVYLAYRDGFDHNSDMHMNDLSMHWNFIKHMLDAGVKHICVAGSFREYGIVNGMASEDMICKPINYYALAKKTLFDAINIYINNASQNICFQWIRPFSVIGDDSRNNSILSKIITWEREGKKTFPCTKGDEEYDYIHVSDAVKQIEAIISQDEVNGIINVCSGIPKSLRDMIEEFLESNNFRIKPVYGEFKRRPYDSDVIYGDRRKIDRIMNKNGKTFG